MNKLIVSSSPHVANVRNTKSIMRDVCVALIPTTIAATIIFGFYTLLMIAVCIGTCILAEYLYNRLLKLPNSTGDWSAVVTGLLLGLNLPPTAPIYMPIIGGIFAIVVVKMLFGGIGKNFANPAITARIFLMLAWGAIMTSYVAPLDYSNGFLGEFFKHFATVFCGVDAVSSATPLSFIKVGELTNISLVNLFLGNVPGCAGEVSAIAILIGGVYLLLKRIIDYKIPLFMILTVALVSLLAKGSEYILPNVLSGGLLLGAFFMATDYSTTPNTHLGRIIFAIGCGLITCVIRFYGNYPEGVSFSILCMNIVTPLLDKYIIPKPFGYVKPKKEAKQ